MFTFPLRKVVPAQEFSDNQERLVSRNIKTAAKKEQPLKAKGIIESG